MLGLGLERLPATVRDALDDSAAVLVLAAQLHEATVRGRRSSQEPDDLMEANDRATLALKGAIARSPTTAIDRGDLLRLAQGLHDAADKVVDATGLADALADRVAEVELRRALAGVVRDGSRALTDALAAFDSDAARLQRATARAADLDREAAGLERQTLARVMTGGDVLAADLTRQWVRAARGATHSYAQLLAQLQLVHA
jgi:uncharacterized protein Yka (UPF0111/DUF47 family)